MVVATTRETVMTIHSLQAMARPAFPDMRVGYESEVPIPASVFNRRETWRMARWWRRFIPLALLGPKW